MKTVDCQDVTALLSAVLDDRLEESERHGIERHLAECTECRRLIDEAEQHDLLVRLDVDSWGEPTGTLPPGFIDAVLDRTVRADRLNRSARIAGWITWSGWMATAACLTLVAGVWFFNSPSTTSTGESSTVALTPTQSDEAGAAETVSRDQRPSENERGTANDTARTTGQSESSPASARNDGAYRLASYYLPGPEVRPFVMDDPIIAMMTDTAETADAAQPSESPQREVAESPVAERIQSELLPQPLRNLDWAEEHALAMTALAMETILDIRSDSFQEVENLRRWIEQDNAIERLTALRRKVDVEYRPVLHNAEAVLTLVVRGPLSTADIREIQDTISRLDLPTHLERMIGRPDRRDPL